ncbi:hypothetical protein M3Y94_01003200 [Aphelenchoides besseyi]|nr:hypothetical protein M3Y94_01003200 [Aphelenchoides besseyi]
MSTMQFQKSTANRTFNNGPRRNEYQRGGNGNQRNNPGLATSRRQQHGGFMGAGNRFGLSKDQPRCPPRMSMSAYRMNLEASLAREPAKWIPAEPLAEPYVEPHVATTSAPQDFREMMWQQHLEGIGNDFALIIDNVPICLSKAVLASGSSFFAPILKCPDTQYHASGVNVEALKKSHRMDVPRSIGRLHGCRGLQDCMPIGMRFVDRSVRLHVRSRVARRNRNRVRAFGHRISGSEASQRRSKVHGNFVRPLDFDLSISGLRPRCLST